MKVLFVGNSHTYFNDMPALFAELVEKTTGRRPEVVMLAYSNRNLEWQCKEYFALRFNLMYGGYDTCVIQQAAHPYPPVESTMTFGGRIIELCHRCGVTPVVFMTWAEKRFPEHQQIMIETCEKLARENHALLAPIGAIWEKIRETDPEIELYYKDGEHASPYGDFLIAAVLCRLLSGGIAENAGAEGLDFMQGGVFDLDMPKAIEEKEKIPVPLDPGRTERILCMVKEWGWEEAAL